MSNDAELRRLRWRCRRGMLELDVVLQAFVERGYGELTERQQGVFARLLSLPDTVLLQYVQGLQEPADEELREIVKKI